jgi:hypothetical protein
MTDALCPLLQQRFQDAVVENLKAVGLESEPVLTPRSPPRKHQHSFSDVSTSTILSTTEDEDEHMTDVDDACLTDEDECLSPRPRTKSDESASSVHLGTPPMPSYINFPIIDFSLEEGAMELVVYQDAQAFLADMASAGFGDSDDSTWRCARSTTASNLVQT